VSDGAELGGAAIPLDVGRLEATAGEMAETAGVLRAAAGRQMMHLRALHTWSGRGHESWVASTERTGRAALAIAMMLTEAAAVLRYLCRAVRDLRWRSAALATRAQVAGYDIARDGTVRRIGPQPAVAMPGGPTPHRPGGPPLPARSAAAFQAEAEGTRLAEQPDLWRTVQLDIAGLLDDACTAYAAARAALRRIVDGQAAASLVPRLARLPDGGGYAIGPLAAAASLTQLPGTRDDLWRVVRRHAGGTVDPAVPRGGRTTAMPAEVARVVADRGLGRAARMNAVARALDRIVAAAGEVPVIPAVASFPVGRVPPLTPNCALGRMPVVNVALAGWSVYQDVSRGGYDVPEAIGREGTVTLAGYAAGEGVGLLVVILGGPPVSAAIVAVGVGLVAGHLFGTLYDKVTRHER
jgi:hypothetical protein